MEEKYKKTIYVMFEKLDPVKDYRFLKQLYTLIKKHLEKEGRR